MKYKRSGAGLALIVAAALSAAACSSDDDGSDGGSGDGSSTNNANTADVSGTVNGEGSTAQQKALEHFSDIVSENSQVELNYSGTGSGDGVKKFLSGDIDFAGSDSALKPEEATQAKTRCGGADAWHIPLVAGPVAISYNLDGVDGLVLTPSLIAKIFDGKITKWNDPAITAVNAGVNLPDEDIKTVYRADESGTTDNFTRFLGDTAKADWSYDHSKTWPNKVGSGQQKSSGVGTAIKATKGSIGYVEWGYATEQKLGLAKIDFGAGPVELTSDTAAAALNKVAFADPASKDLQVKTDDLFALKEAGAYPLLLTTYEIVCSTGNKNAEALKAALNISLEQGQEGLADIGYVPLPADYKTKLKATIDALS